MAPNRKLRDSVKKIIAYNQSYKCSHCSIILPPSYQIDHIIPFAISNDDSDTNLQALCSTCHTNKTQKESYRILKYKELCSQEYTVCWFCLESYEDHHNCDKVLKDIEKIMKKQQQVISSFQELCNKYKYTGVKYRQNVDDVVNDVISDMNNLTITNVLNVKISSKYVYVNRYIYKVNEDFTVKDIANAIFISTRSKKESRRYSKVVVKLIIDGGHIREYEECLDHLTETLPDMIPERILSDNVEFEFLHI